MDHKLTGFRALPVRRHVTALALALAALAAMAAYRAWFVEPREWVALCGGQSAPAACAVRSALVWGQVNHAWGVAALALGLAAFVVQRPLALCVAAVVMGGWAVQNFNAPWGMIGAALGALAWLRANDPQAA